MIQCAVEHSVAPASPEATVVIATRDRLGALTRCLNALMAQRERRLKVLVVDDGSRAPEGVTAAASRAGAHVLQTRGLGVAGARNAGARAAATPVVCFLDDDCEPGPAWSGALLSAVESGADVVAGRTVNALPNSPLAIAHYLVAGALGCDAAVRARFAPGGNLASRRELLLAEPFDELLSRLGAEDREWWGRLSGLGYRLEVEPDAVAGHRPELTLGGFLRKQFRYGRGAYLVRRRHYAGHLERPAFYTMLLVRGFAHGPRAGAIVALGQIATALGFAAQALASGSSPRR